jgi:hypothetical protein
MIALRHSAVRQSLVALILTIGLQGRRRAPPVSVDGGHQPGPSSERAWHGQRPRHPGGSFGQFALVPTVQFLR